MPSIDEIQRLRELLGTPVVLLPLQPGTKKCHVRAWQKVKPEDTLVEAYVAKLITSNIAVSLGSPSGGLVSIDFDDDLAATQFLDANPGLTGSLRTRGVRGCNIWIRIEGDYPSSAKLMRKDRDETVGEWRSTGNYTVIHGKHPSGCDYTRLVDAPVVTVPYRDIVWPAHFGLSDPAKSLTRVTGVPLSQVLIDSRRTIVSGLFDDLEWVSDTEAFCACPGKGKHTNLDGPRDCRVHLDGVPTVHCLHTSCQGDVARMNQVLRKAVRSQEVVLIPDGFVKVGDSAEQLFTILKTTGKFYSRGGLVCEVVQGSTGPELRPVDKTRAVSVFEKYVSFGIKSTNKEGQPAVTPCALPENWAAIFLKTDERLILPPVDSVVSIPILYVDASGALLVHQDGYNPPTRTFVANPDPTKKLPPVSLVDSIAMVSDTLSDFDFEGPSHRSRAIASFITPGLVFAGLLGGRPPVDVAEADASQSGKNFRHKLVCAIYGESPTPIAQRKGGVGGLDESFSEALIRGRPFPQLDNLRGRLDSPFIESFLTADKTVGARGFMRGEVEVDVRKFCTLITSNDLQFTEDLANRSSIVRIKKKPDGYVWKCYNGLRLDEHIKTHHLRYLSAIYTIIQEWHRQGCQVLHREHHDFRWWSGRLDWIIANLFPGEAPLLSGHRNAQTRAGDDRINWWQRVAVAVAKEGRLGEPLQMLDITDVCLNNGIPIYRRPEESNRTFSSDADELRYLGGKFAPLFKRGKGLLPLDGFQVVRKETTAQRASDQTSYPVKAYVFTSTEDAGPSPTPTPKEEEPSLPLLPAAPDSTAFTQTTAP